MAFIRLKQTIYTTVRAVKREGTIVQASLIEKVREVYDKNMKMFLNDTHSFKISLYYTVYNREVLSLCAVFNRSYF